MRATTPGEIAMRCAEVMWKEDRAARELGVILDSVGPGIATTSMRVEDRHLNGKGMCHGGVIFTLADVAFAYACNSYNHVAVAQFNTISFIAPGKSGERLTAVARETMNNGRQGIYDITVTSDDGHVVAEFRGNSKVIKGRHFDESED
ncbi:MAG: hydroxyphenylacetyl-CoA thioesterase PaaI [Rhodobacteraceae bacterium]|nr:hydroxyphenylacetyl-CoA thioesterase PaaI [Paracoccaceae bacterium]